MLIACDPELLDGNAVNELDYLKYRNVQDLLLHLVIHVGGFNRESVQEEYGNGVLKDELKKLMVRRLDSIDLVHHPVEGGMQHVIIAYIVIIFTEHFSDSCNGSHSSSSHSVSGQRPLSRFCTGRQ